MGEWENSDNFYLKSLNNRQHCKLVSLYQYRFAMSYECPESQVLRANKWGATNGVPKMVQRYQRIFRALSSHIESKVAILEVGMHDSGAIHS